MNNFKYQFFAILLAMAIGAAAMGYYMSLRNDKELLEQEQKHKQELKNRVELALETIAKRDSIILKLDSISHEDSLKIISLEKKIEADGVRMAKLIKDINKLSPDEKVDWLINRYK